MRMLPPKAAPTLAGTFMIDSAALPDAVITTEATEPEPEPVEQEEEEA